jgi:hypothetical protein
MSTAEATSLPRVRSSSIVGHQLADRPFQRVIGKFVDGTPDSESRAQRAFGYALELNPRLSVAHRFYAQLEGDMGQARRALVRLLSEANRHGNDPELFAGLVHACRYCGLYDESIAAHAEARRLDPNVPTSFGQTLLMASDFERLLAVEPPPLGTGSDEWAQARVTALGLQGRRDESRPPADMLAALAAVSSLTIHDDPRICLPGGMVAVRCGRARARPPVSSASPHQGVLCAPTLSASRSFDPLRSDPRFQAILAEAEVGRR